jgi:hypothetical protein
VSGTWALAAENRFPALIGKEMESMRISGLSKGFTMVLVLLLCAAAFASNKGSFQVSTAVLVNGKQLAPGEYSVRWEGSGPEVQVSFLKGKNVIVTAPAHLVDLNASPASDSAVLKKNEDGSSSLDQIRFGGKKKALALDGATPQT